MKLADLIDDSLIDDGPLKDGPVQDGPVITGVTADSRAVRPGFLFAALPGTHGDGRAYIGDAVAHGAVAILAARGTGAGTDAGPSPAGVVVIEDDHPRRRFARLAARFHGTQPETVVAVTGTNGKTSVATFARQIWTRLGHSAASLGTLGLSAPGIETHGGLTTPDPDGLHRTLASLARQGIDHLAMEASSHGLDQCRLDGVRLAAAAFTNLTRDHLDYHGSMEAYQAAKLRLFAELLPPGAPAVLNADDPAFPAFAAVCAGRGLGVLSYGAAGRDLRLVEVILCGHGQDLRLEVFGQPHAVHLPLAGGFQAHNAVCALGLVLAAAGTAVDVPAAVATLGRLTGVPGRLQRVATRVNGAPVYVDYAHTPDALETVLNALRPHTVGRLVVVFGCGGDRDRGKRPQMGAIAARRADVVLVTDDNPRSEPPEAIRAAILAASPGATEIGDRRAAIHAAVAGLGPDDVLVVAGKGHERGQIVGTTVLPFDDADAARDAVAAVEGGLA